MPLYRVNSMDQVSQRYFCSSLLLQVHTRFPHHLQFLLSESCKAELVILAKKMKVHYSLQLFIAAERPKKKGIGNLSSPKNFLARTKNYGYGHMHISILCHFYHQNFCISHAYNVTTLMNKCIIKRDNAIVCLSIQPTHFQKEHCSTSNNEFKFMQSICFSYSSQFVQLPGDQIKWQFQIVFCKCLCYYQLVSNVFEQFVVWAVCVPFASTIHFLNICQVPHCCFFLSRKYSCNFKSSNQCIMHFH